MPSTVCGDAVLAELGFTLRDLRNGSGEGMDIEGLHHVSLPVTDLERSRAFYRDVLGLQELPRPNLYLPGTWFRINSTQELHLTVEPRGTFRSERHLLGTDGHFAVRVQSHKQALESLRAKGFREDAPEADGRRLRIGHVAGYPQIFILDPDGHIIEVNSLNAD